MRIGTSYKQHGIDGTYDAIIIGSGIGGLASAALLAKHAGKKVLVLERHYTAGGFTHTFQRPGYEWDVGVHYIGKTSPKNLLRQVFDDITDGQLAWADMGDVYDTIVIGDQRYPLVKGRRRFRECMLDYFPGEQKALDAYLDRVARTVKASHPFFAEKALPNPVAGLLGPLMRYPVMRHGRKTTLEVLRSMTDNPKLIGVLAGQYGNYGLPPAQSSFFIHALVVDHYFGGGAYPVGGSAQIAATILPIIEGAGGKVLTSAEVDEVVIERERAAGVRLADGFEVRAPVVISDAGVNNTFGKLVPRSVATRHGFNARLTKVEPSVAHASLYLGLDKTARELGLEKSNLWIYPGYDHDANVARFVAEPDAPLPVAYVSFPSAKDPDFERRYPGKAAVEVITLAPSDWFVDWQGTHWRKRGAKYEAFKEKLTGRMLEALYGQCPQIKGALDHCELSTPLSTAHFTAHAHGEIYGIAHTPQRFGQRWLRPRTPVRNLYLTGADIGSAGVGGALFGAVLTASAVVGKNLLTTITKRRPTDGSVSAARGEKRLKSQSY